MTDLGTLLLGLSLLGSVVSIVALIFGHLTGPKDGKTLTSVGYIGALVVFFTTTLATLLLLVAVMTKDYSFLYVASEHSNDVTNLAWLYDFSALWAGREGSLLFWAWLLSAFTAAMAWRRMSISDAVSNLSIAVLGIVQIFFTVALFFDTNNPFRAATTLADGSVYNAAGKLVGNIAQMGMSPLLQHWAMILHPPTLFIGYAGLTVPFAFAIGALLARDGSSKWVEIVDRITVFSWLMLGIGIGLGAIWAYVDLNFGGYWAWDPVENASLLPWLTGVGLLHSFTVYRRRGAFKMWAVMMSSVTFVLVLLGTFITRSGVVQSVHAFQKDALSLWWFLGMMIVSLVVPALLLLWRKKEFGSDSEFTSLMSKEGSYYFNNVLMLFAAVLVAGLTLSPAFGLPKFGPSSFDLLARPVGIFYVLLMTVCPILSWGITDRATFWKRVKWPLGIGAVLSAGLLAIWALVLLPNYTPTTTGLPALLSVQAPIDHIQSIIGLLIAGFAIALPIYLFVDSSRKRAAARGENPFVSFFNILFKSRTQSGGYMTHLGIGIVLVGLIGSTMYVKDVPFEIADTAGTRQKVGSYEVAYKGVTLDTRTNGDTVRTWTLDLYKDGALLGEVTPYLESYASGGEEISKASVNSQIFGDFYITWRGTGTGTVAFDAKINPLIWWAWVGFGLTIIGTGIAMWPKRDRQLALVPAPVAVTKKKKR
jgi:cytochrome c-type biogenesis protein CcmF